VAVWIAWSRWAASLSLSSGAHLSIASSLRGSGWMRASFRWHISSLEDARSMTPREALLHRIPYHRLNGLARLRPVAPSFFHNLSILLPRRRRSAPKSATHSPLTPLVERGSNFLPRVERESVKPAAQQHSQARPRQLSRPSRSAKAAMTRAAAGSAHHQPATALRRSPARSATER